MSFHPHRYKFRLFLHDFNLLIAKYLNRKAKIYFYDINQLDL